jgi:hypothetical protein
MGVRRCSYRQQQSGALAASGKGSLHIADTLPVELFRVYTNSEWGGIPDRGHSSFDRLGGSSDRWVEIGTLVL